MGSNILDDPREPVENTFSRKAFRSAKIAWGLMLLLFSMSIFMVLTSAVPLPSILNPIMMLIFLGSVFTATIGLIQSIKSYIRREPFSTKRAIALIGNLIIITFFLYNIISDVMYSGTFEDL